MLGNGNGDVGGELGEMQGDSYICRAEEFHLLSRVCTGAAFPVTYISVTSISVTKKSGLQAR